MANIALQGGKVILKNGKASCTCCCVATCSCSPFCGFTQLKITPPPPDWPTPYIIVNGCNDGSFFCDIFAWSYPTILSVSVDTTEGFAFFASSYAGNGLQMAGTPYGTYSNGITIEPYVP